MSTMQYDQECAELKHMISEIQSLMNNGTELDVKTLDGLVYNTVIALESFRDRCISNVILTWVDQEILDWTNLLNELSELGVQ